MKFRKKPIVVDAVQLPAAGLDMDEAAKADLAHLLRDADWSPEDSETLVIRTLEGEMVASPGDWIIRGIKGECYPCKPDIFAVTYEPVDD